MAPGITLYLALLALFAPDPVEERFVAALRSDLESGRAAKTGALIAPEVRAALSDAVLTDVYRAWKSYGKVKSLEVDPATPFGLERRVRFVLVQEREESHVVCHFDAKGRLDGIRFLPAPRDWARAKIDEVAQAWDGDYAYCVARTKRGEKGVTSDRRARGEGPFPLGSIFKLYVLAELARQMEEGKLRAEDRVKVEARWKSFPSGVLHERPAGTEVSVDDLAGSMIAISDNTATDHLIHLVGRENIEARLEALHNSCPGRNKPFLTTREMFVMKGGAKESEIGLTFAELCERWPTAGRAQRMKWLRGMTAPFDDMPHEDLMRVVSVGYGIRSNAVREHLTFEWFAEPEDVCALLLAAWRREIPGAKHFLRYYARGSEIYPREWVAYYGFKGGSETNVMAMSALAVSREGEAVAVCVCRRGDLGEFASGEVARLAGALLHGSLRGSRGAADER